MPAKERDRILELDGIRARGGIERPDRRRQLRVSQAPRRTVFFSSSSFSAWACSALTRAPGGRLLSANVLDFDEFLALSVCTKVQP